MFKRMTKRWAPVFFVSIAVMVLQADSAEAKRIALLIGNQNYEATAQLKNPANDVDLMKG